MIHPHILQKLDERTIPDNRNEVRVFATVQNEMLRLPNFYEFYRKLGVSRFIFVDNNSTDGTREYLLAQPDAHVFWTDDSYRESRYGIDWQNKLLNAYGTGQWCLYVDADELIKYPHIETLDLPGLCRFLDQEGSEALLTFLLDMYPKGSLSATVYHAGDDMFSYAPCFDRDYSFMKRISLKGSRLFPENDVVGGPRLRCFFPEQKTNDPALRLQQFLTRRVIGYLQHLVPPLKVPVKAPDLFKVPLVKWKAGDSYEASTHIINRQKLSSVTGVLAHFKFLSDFHERVANAVKHGQHFGGSVEYKRYQAMLQSGADQGFQYTGTQVYQSSQQLLDLGLIRSSSMFDTFVSEQNGVSR